MIPFDTIDDARRGIASVGRGALLSKFDWAEAYRACKVCPSDWDKLGFCFNKKFYCDLSVAMGLRSAAFIQGRIAGVFKWILCRFCKIKHFYFYADDALLVEHPSDASKTTALIEWFYKILGIPLSLSKREGPCPCLKFLGFIFDTLSMEMRVPEEKILEIRKLIKSFLSRPKCKARDLKSILGKLIFISQAVPAGRAFVSRFIELIPKVYNPHQHIRINSEARLDAMWWDRFLDSYNGINLIREEICVDSNDLMFACDASLEAGGCFCGKNWTFVRWEEPQKS